MCGILGFNWEDKKLCKNMLDSIKHRGPNDEGVYNDKNLTLGHKRLSIIDLSKKGHQPMEYEDLVMIYNGEVYNFKEVRTKLEKEGYKFDSNSDTEVILKAYHKYKESCLELFNGMFAFAIYDSKNKTIFIARDRIGIKPLYYYNKDNKLIFASEIKAILQDKEINKEINDSALNDYLSLRYISTGKTIIKDIKRLLPGHYLKYNLKTNHLEIKQYWDIKEDIQNKDEKYFIGEIKKLLEESVELMTISDVPIGTYLSGGLDSSIITGILSKNSTVNTFSITFANDEVGNESNYAKIVSEKFKTNHKEIVVSPDVTKIFEKIIWHLDEPIADPAIVPVYILSEHATKNVKVILTGDGADELFCGYDQYKFMNIIKKTSKLPYCLTKHSISAGIKLAPKSLINKYYRYAGENKEAGIKRLNLAIKDFKNNKPKSFLDVISIFDETEKKELLKNYTNDEELINNISNSFKKSKHLENQMILHDLKNYLPENLLMKPDKMAMAHSLECRVPFLDHRLIELSMKIPVNLKINGSTTKYILKKAYQDLLPKEIVYRKKQPFQVPLDQWMSQGLKEFFENELLSKDSVYFNKTKVEEIIKNYKKSPLYYSRQLWSLATFNTWHKLYIQGK
nr:asparagine synthase (glutamine-hydrolyzing) [Nanoarchaeum sp.]